MTTGFGPPPPVGYDLVVDLRELKNLGSARPAKYRLAALTIGESVRDEVATMTDAVGPLRCAQVR